MVKEAPTPLPLGTLSGPEVEVLFSGKTVESVSVTRGYTSYTYYDPNGEARQVREGQRRYGHWRINESGRICLQMEVGREKCRIIVQEGGVYKKYVVKKDGNHELVVRYRSFRVGNPLEL